MRAGPRASVTSLGQSANTASNSAPLPPPPPVPASAAPAQGQAPSAPPPALPRRPPPVARPPPPQVEAAKVTFSENNPFLTSEPFPPPPPEATSINATEEPTDRPVLTKRESQSAIEDIKDEVDDTMRNLRKTFAGIFGDM